MDALLLVAATALVGKKYMDERNMKQKLENESFADETIDSLEVQNTEQPEEPEQPEPQTTLGGPVPSNNDFFQQLGISHNVTSGGLPFVPDNVAVEVAQKKETEDTSYFHEQFYPSDTKNTGFSVERKPWMLAEEAAYTHPKTERLADAPTRADVHDIDFNSKIRDFGNLHTEYTTHIAKSKNNESPIESIWTGNGSKEGFHPNSMNQHHKFLLSDNPLLHLPNGPRGAFIGGALKSDQPDKTLTTFKKDRSTEISGIPGSKIFKIPFQSSFKTDPSNAEGYLIEKQIESSSRAPVNKTSTNIASSVSVAHDDNVNTFAKKLFASRKARSKRDAIALEEDATFKIAEIDTPTVVGAGGGTRSLAVQKDAEVKTSSHHENLGVSASQVLTSVGAMALKKDRSFVTKPSVEQPDARLSETESYDTKMRKTSRMEKKQIDTAEEMTFDGKKETINEKEFTSSNLLAPVDKNLPEFLRFKPTTSLSLVKKAIQIKRDNESVENFEDRLGASKLIRNPIKNKKSAVNHEMEAKNNSELFSTLLMDRLGRAGGGRSMPNRRGFPTLRDAHFRANLEIENVN